MKFGRCILLLFSLYRLRKLRPREAKRLTQWHSFPVFFPQTHCIPSSLPPSHSNLYITNEHLVDLQPEPVHPFPAPSRHTHQQAGHAQQISYAQILFKRGWSNHFSLWVGGLPTVGSTPLSRPTGSSLLIYLPAARVKHSRSQALGTCSCLILKAATIKKGSPEREMACPAPICQSTSSNWASAVHQGTMLWLYQSPLSQNPQPVRETDH